MKQILFTVIPQIIMGMFCVTSWAQVVINEYSASNLKGIEDNYLKHEDWFELYNKDTLSVNIGGYYLSDRVVNTKKWQIPAGVTIPAKGYLIFFASGRDTTLSGNYHLSFKLTQTKAIPEYIVVADTGGMILDSIHLSITQADHSRGRFPNGSSNWSIFTTPTPKTSNDASKTYSRYANKPVPDMPAGYYTGSVAVALSTTDSTDKIRYTTNGTKTKSTSTLYSTPLTFSSTTLLKAQTYSSDTTVLPSMIEFNTYFINVSHTLPVISVGADSLQLMLNGDETIKPVGSIEYFNGNKIRSTSAYGEFNKHGQDSWVLDQRSFDIVVRDEHGYNYALLEKIISLTNRDKYQRLILRASGDDNYPANHNPDNIGSCHLRDSYVQNMAKMGGLHLDVRTAERGVVYVDGQYWGVYEFREKVDDHDYTDIYYDQGKYDLQYLLLWGSTWAEYGGNQAFTDWNALYNYIMNNNMAVAANYDYVTTQYNVKSLVDYILVNMFTVCSDWVNYNVGWWRGKNPLGEHKKWGYILWDNDATFGHYINYTGIPTTGPNASPCDPEGLPYGWPDVEGHIRILNKLRDNAVFNQYYISRSIDLSNTVFSCDSMLAVLDKYVDLIEPEMTQQAQRWAGTYSEWASNVQSLRNYIIQRCAAYGNGMNNCYSLTGPYNLLFSVDPPGTGNINVNSLSLNQYPWTGSYFGGIDINLSAVPDTNYAFVKWELKKHTLTSDTAKSATLNITMQDTVIAHFQNTSVVPGMDIFSLSSHVSVNPNPAKNVASMTFDLKEPSDVKIEIYSMLGEKIYSVSSGIYLAGRNVVNFSVANIPQGIYFINVNTQKEKIIGKFVVTR